LDALQEQQKQGSFIKEYGALTDSAPQPLLPGFPPAGPPANLSAEPPSVIESGFRPYGPGRRAVRPVLLDREFKKNLPVARDQGRPYQTGLLERRCSGDTLYFRVRITRAFRHQIRCHLSWLGHPVLGDSLYSRSGENGEQPLMLKAQSLSFLDPLSGRPRHYQLPPISEQQLAGNREQGAIDKVSFGDNCVQLDKPDCNRQF
jgi:23S rRNA pseudouridine1911/1915/1917 synthase